MGSTASTSDESGAGPDGGSSREKRIAFIWGDTVTGPSLGRVVSRRNQGTRETRVAAGISARSCAFRLHIGRTGRKRAAKTRIAADARQNLAGGGSGSVCGSGGGAANPPKS